MIDVELVSPEACAGSVGFAATQNAGRRDLPMAPKRDVVNLRQNSHRVLTFCTNFTYTQLFFNYEHKAGSQRPPRC